MDLKNLCRNIASGDRAHSRMQRTGVNPQGHPLWTKGEVQTVVSLHPDYPKIKKALKRRSMPAIRHKAGELGLTKKFHYWTAAEVPTLRKLYPSASKEEILQALPGIHWGQVRNCVKYNGFYRKPKPFKVTGHPLIDTVRKRAFELGLSMVDLDEMARTKKYFQKAAWHSHKSINRKAVLRAIEALDGEIHIEWND